jgi:hypothetical protein
LQRAAVIALLSQPAGAKLVAEQYLAGKLPKELRGEIARGLRKHADQPELAKLRAEVLASGKE